MDEDNFAWLGCNGDEIDTKSSTGEDRVELSADCDRVVVPPADAEVDSVVGVGKLEGVCLAPSSVVIGVVVGR